MAEVSTTPQAHRGPSRGSEILEVVTTGLPFCVFKGIVARVLLRDAGSVVAAPLFCLAVADTAINLANLVALAAVGGRVVSACTLAEIAHRSRRLTGSPDAWLRDLGNAADVLLSFALVAGMVGFGGIARLQPLELSVWNLAVVLNVLGAGLARMRAAVHRPL